MDLILFILGIFCISTGVNAPNLLVGYGLVIFYILLIIAYMPSYRGVLIFFLAHLVSAGLMIYTDAAFTQVIILSLFVRTLLLAIIIYYYRHGYLDNLASRLLLVVVLEVAIAYTIALLYYAHDAIEVGLDIYSALYIPFIYLSYRYYHRGDKLSASTLVALALIYYASASYFPAIPLLLIVLAGYIIYLGRWINIRYTPIGLGAAIILASIISQPALYYNLLIITYPFQPNSLSGKQWIQVSGDEECLNGNIFQYTYDPQRLRILNKCVSIVGTVASHPVINDDGDITFELEPDPQYHYMLSIGSYILRRGRIHVEIVPHDQGNVYIPEKGERVRVVGAWVVDTDHGSYTEIHPTWLIEVLS